MKTRITKKNILLKIWSRYSMTVKCGFCFKQISIVSYMEEESNQV